jgi:hypothetical protein
MDNNIVSAVKSVAVIGCYKQGSILNSKGGYLCDVPNKSFHLCRNSHSEVSDRDAARLDCTGPKENYETKGEFRCTQKNPIYPSLWSLPF